MRRLIVAVGGALAGALALERPGMAYGEKAPDKKVRRLLDVSLLLILVGTIATIVTALFGPWGLFDALPK